MGDRPEGEGALAISAWALAQDLTEMGEPAQAAQAVRQLVDLGLLALPQPGGGRTPERIAALVALGAAACVLARPAEGHAIFSELKGPEPGPSQLWGYRQPDPREWGWSGWPRVGRGKWPGFRPHQELPGFARSCREHTGGDRGARRPRSVPPGAAV